MSKSRPKNYNRFEDDYDDDYEEFSQKRNKNQEKRKAAAVKNHRLDELIKPDETGV